MAKKVIVGGRIESKEVGGIVTGAAEILDDSKGKKQSVINHETDAELQHLDQSKQDNLTFDNTPTDGSNNPVKSAGVYAADKALSDAIEAILLLIPSAASALNKLVDQATMNSSISTATATFMGTYNVVTDLELAIDATHEQIAAKLAQVVSEADNNDYAFVQVPVSAESTDIRRTERYKFNGTEWGYEYDLNTSGFTAAQWAAINSGITLALVAKLSGLPTSSELMALLGQKQDTLTFDNIPTSGSANPVKSGGVYEAINDEKTAREQLAQTVTGIDGRVGDVEEVIPAGAAANNKLVANSSMEAYVASIINAITASFTIATADGHINISLTQTNGRVASLTLTSSDIASAQALTALTGRVTTAESNITSLGGRVSTNETDIANLQQLYNDLQQSKPVPVTTLPSTGQQQGVIYRLAGTNSYSDYMWNGSTWVLMATYNNAIDPRPKKGSGNLVTSGGVFDNMCALDISELNATENPHTLATYADLAAALAAVPSDYQKGGMSVKFIQSSDNKYVQYFLNAQTFTTDVSAWEKMNLEEEVSQLDQKVFNIYGSFTVVATDTWQQFSLPFVIKAGQKIHNNGVRIGLLKQEGQSGEQYINTDGYAVAEFDIYRVRTLNTVGTIDINVSKIWGKESLSDEILSKGDVIDNLSTEATQKSLSANMGKTLNQNISNSYYLDFKETPSDTFLVYNIGTVKKGIKAINKGATSVFLGKRGDEQKIQLLVGESIILSKDIDYIQNWTTSELHIVFTKLWSEESLDVHFAKDVEYVTLTATSYNDPNADFTGNTAIRDAIHSITDASPYKQYIIRCSGNFIAKLPTDYEEAPAAVEGLGKFALFWLKPYIHLDGIDNNNCVIRAELPDSLADCQADKPSFVKSDYGMYQPLHCGWYSHNIKNITFEARNTRFPLHIDAGVETKDKVFNVENCRLIHEGKFGDSIGTTGGSANGFGTSDGCVYNFKNCTFVGYLTSYYHDNHNFENKSQMFFDNCDFSNLGTPTIANGIALSSLENIVGSSVKYRNCNFPHYTWLTIYDLSSTIDRADSLRIDARMDLYPLPIYNHSNALGLRVVASSNNTDVLFDKNSSAYDDIVGYSEEVDYIKYNRYGYEQQYGMEYRAGGLGFPGVAIGLKNIDTGDGNSNHSMGKRLGDCRTNNKSLVITIGSTSHTITFDQDYTNMSNSDILAIINTELGADATADLYHVNYDWYPLFKGIEFIKVNDETSVLVGMGVVNTATGVRKATKNDTHIDGIALDNGDNGGMIRIITKGKLNYNLSAPWRYGVRHTGPSYHGSVTYGTQYGIGDTDGVFSPNAENPTIRKAFDESWEII